MEQVLLDKIKANDMDDIDKVMIAARLANGVTDLHELVGKFCTDIEELCKKYKDEFAIADVGIACGVTDGTEENIGLKIAFGSTGSILKCLRQITDELVKESFMKRIYIDSYYSDSDWRDKNFNCIDGFYRVDYPDDVDIKKEIEKTYRTYEDEYESVSSLETVLHDLWKQKIVLNYQVLEYESFNCDYGTFKE